MIVESNRQENSFFGDESYLNTHMKESISEQNDENKLILNKSLMMDSQSIGKSFDNES
jgi:hypothetical protein